MKYIGLDLGTKTLGIAISDRLGIIASPYKVLRFSNTEEIIPELKSIIDTNEISIIVLGLPLNMNNTAGESVRRTEEFKNKIENIFSLPIFFQDERLSTRQAEGILIEADVSRKKRKKIIDKMAAVIILQTYLDRKKGD